MKKYVLAALALLSITAFASDNTVSQTSATSCASLAEDTVKEKASVVNIIYTEDNEAQALTCHAALLALNSGMKIQMQPQDGKDYFKILILDRYSKWEFWKYYIY